MEKILRKFPSLEAADRADDEHYRALKGDEKLRLLLELLLTENSDEAVIQRSARVYPLAERRRG